jgi:hypothetical protein
MRTKEDINMQNMLLPKMILFLKKYKLYQKLSYAFFIFYILFVKKIYNGSRMVQEWFKNGSRMVQEWFKNGSRMVQEWFKNV